MTLNSGALALYRALLRALPEGARERYAAALDVTVGDVVGDAARRGRLEVLTLLPRLLADLFASIVFEHWTDLVRDTRYAVRMLVRAPGFSAAAVLCLSIGIGLTAAMYAQIQSTMLRELPAVGAASTLVRLQKPLQFRYLEGVRESGVFATLTAYAGPVPAAVVVRGGGRERVWAQLVTPEYFEVLGVQPLAGRFFAADDRRRGAGQSVVLSERLWRVRYGADPAIVGSAVRVNGHLVTVAGVAPPEFRGASPMTAAADLWMPTSAPVSLAPELAELLPSSAGAVEIVGRLAGGLTPAQAEATLEPLVRRLELIHGDPGRFSSDRRIHVVPGGRMFPVRDEDLPRAVGFPVLLVSLVLLMACANVANMILARGEARRAEIALRLSLGARPGRIVRQLLTETLVLVTLGAAGGALLARWLLTAFETLRPAMPGYVDYQTAFSWPALAGAALVAGASSLLFGVAPARRASRLGVHAALKPGAASGAGRRRLFGLRNLLVFQQVAVSVLLLLLTAFVVIGWRRAVVTDMGFQPANLYVVTLDPVRDGFTGERARTLFEQLPDRLRGVSGVAGIATAQTLPLAMSSGELMLGAKTDFVDGTKALGAVRVERVGAGFFETLGTPLLGGRDFTVRDERDSSRALIVNSTLAAQVWAGADPVGQTLDLGEDRWQVIGVVADMRSAFPFAGTLPAAYRPITPAGFEKPSRHGVSLIVRVVPGVDAPAMLRDAIASYDPAVTVFEVKRMADELDQAAYLSRFASFAYGGMGLFGLILACVGLAAVTAYAVAQRTREIGIRMALGAQRGSVLWLVLREGAAIVITGTAVGLLISVLAVRALSSVLDTLAETTRTSLSDPLLLVGAPALLAVLALAACYVPARRAVRIDPLRALRSE